MSIERNNHHCAHCGADCGKTPVTGNGLKFCCNGCKTVYDLLHENKLFTYYTLEKNPGIKLNEAEPLSRYDFLDQQEIADKLILFSEGEIAKTRFYIPVIHCVSCIWLLEHLEKLHPGIIFSIVNFPKKEVDITFRKSQISLRQVVELLASIHYIPDLSASGVKSAKDIDSYKHLLFKIGVAGFVFLNVMTYSLPAYFNGKPVEGKLGLFLSVLSYLLTIPVVFYSAGDYYVSAWKSLRKKSISIDLPIAIGILALFTVTSVEVISGKGQGYSDSLSGLIFFLLTGKWYQGKSYEALSFERNYKSYFPIAVTRMNKQLEESILIDKVKAGDFLLIRNKELIPADSVLVEGQGLIDYSFVTGESTPVLKSTGDFLYAGGRQSGGMITIKVEKPVDQSHLTRLWNQDKTYGYKQESMKTLTDRVSQYFTIYVILIALSGLLYWAFRGESSKAWFVFTSVLIIACPCALALTVPFTFGNTMRIFGRKGLYIKNTSVIERLTRIDTIVFDKTGTLTIPHETQVVFSGDPLSEQEMEAVYSLARQSAHPMSVALVRHLVDFNYAAPEFFTEIAGRGVFGKVNGMTIRYGSEEFVTGKTTVKNTAVIFIRINETDRGVFQISNFYRDQFRQVIDSLKNAFDLYLLSGDNDAEQKFLGQFFDPDKMYFNQKPQDKATMIDSLQQKGKVVLMTGDGLNDAGALMQSDVALTIANKAYQFSPASDAVLESGKFHLLARFIHFTRTSLNIVRVSFLISLIYNVAGIGLALAGHMSPLVAAILMPASSVSVVAFATFSTRIWGWIELKG